METRKVQITGRSTYVVSLPKTWVKKVKITNGDSIGMIPRSDGTLLVNPKLTERGEKISEEFRKEISINSNNMKHFIREFIGVYLAGYNTIKMNFNNPVSKDMRKNIRNLSHDVIGPEIIDESINSVTVKDLLDASDFSIVKGVKRMYIISKGMYTDALNSFENRDTDLAEDVEARDNDVDKLHWLISKQFNLILKDVFFADKMGVKPQQALGFLLTARSIERIADHATRLAENTKNLKGKTPLDSKVIQVGNEVLEMFNDSIKSMNRSDIKHAHEVIDSSEKIKKDIEKLRQDILSLKVDVVNIVSLVYIVDSLERIRGYAEDIAETAINHHFVS